MYPTDVFRHTVSRLVAILQRHGVRFHLTGGITSVAYGEPRMTQDVDVVVENAAIARVIDLFIAAATQAGFLLDADSVRRAVADKSMFQLFDTDEALKIDVYPRELVPGELDRSTLLEVFEGLPLPVASRPDAAASKLAWAAKGSHKSRRDLRQIVRPMTTTDRSELDRLVGILDLGDLLADTDLKLAAIAARCGFAHAAQLCTVFKKTFGLTPTEHRRQCQPWTTPPA